METVTLQLAATTIDGSPAKGRVRLSYDGGLMLNRHVSVYPESVTADLIEQSIEVGEQIAQVGYAEFVVPASNADAPGAGGTYTATVDLSTGGRHKATFYADKDSPDRVIWISGFQSVDPDPGVPVGVVTYDGVKSWISDLVPEKVAEAVAENPSLIEAARDRVLDAAGIARQTDQPSGAATAVMHGPERRISWTAVTQDGGPTSYGLARIGITHRADVDTPLGAMTDDGRYVPVLAGDHIGLAPVLLESVRADLGLDHPQAPSSLMVLGDSMGAIAIEPGQRAVSNRPWPVILAETLAAPVENTSWAGRGIDSIAARCGAVPARLMDATVAAPTAEIRLDYELTTGTELCTILGVPGTISRIEQSDTTRYHFRADEIEQPLLIPAGTPVVMHTARPAGVLPIISGPWNSLHVMTADQVASFILAIGSTFARTGSGSWLALDVPPNLSEPYESRGRERLDAVNATLATACVGHFAPAYAWLRTNEAFQAVGATPTVSDKDDIARGFTPRSFRGDTVHLTALGAQALAHYIAADLRTRRIF